MSIQWRRLCQVLCESYDPIVVLNVVIATVIITVITLGVFPDACSYLAIPLVDSASTHLAVVLFSEEQIVYTVLWGQ